MSLGVNVIYQADLMISAGDADIVVAGGMESMTRAPYLLLGARSGCRFGAGSLIDAMLYDGLEDARSHRAVGAESKKYMSRFPHVPGPGRTNSRSALTNGRIEQPKTVSSRGTSACERVPVKVTQRDGSDLIVGADEGMRPETTLACWPPCGAYSPKAGQSPPAMPVRSAMVPPRSY